MNYSLYGNPFYPPYVPYNPYERGYANNYFLNSCVEKQATLESETKRASSNSDAKNNHNGFVEEIFLSDSKESNDFFSLTGNRLQVFGISINIDDLIILVILFFMFKETDMDYILIIVLALILFDQD